MKKLIKFLVILLGILVILFLAIWFYLQTYKPDYSGELKISGLTSPVEVYYDHFGIPHIYAENEHDAYMALGFVHAQDRLFQMEMMRRVGGGKLSEILGNSLVETDKFFRTVGIDQIATKTVNKYYNPNDSSSKVVAAYIKGVNSYIKNGNLPIEYTLLGVSPDEFTVKDMFLIAGYMSYSFAAALRVEPITDKIYSKLGADYINELGLKYGKGTEKIYNYMQSDTLFVSRLTQKVSQMMENLPVPILYGSNSWVISPQKSASGKVLFANDTHIGYAQPSVWFEASINYPGFSMYGNFLAGVPFALLGHNEYSAWGLTMFENDDMDLYREKLNPEDSNQVWAIDKWENLNVRHEIIKVKGGKDVAFDVKSTRHGPIMNNVVETLNGNEQPIAMWWIYTKMHAGLLDAFYGLNHSKTIKDAEKAASMIAAPGLNIMYGDKAGNIAWWAAAKLIKRPKHVNPLLILDGASGNDDILGYRDFDSNPKAINPPWGYVYSANNQPDSVDGEYYPGYYAPEFRAKEIVQFLQEDKKWTLEDFMKMQTNVRSSTHPLIINSLLLLVAQKDLNANEKRCFSILEQWNGEHELEDVAPTIYYKFLYNLLYETFADELGEKDFDGFVSTHTMGRSFPSIFINENSVWWDNLLTKKKESRAEIVNKAFLESVGQLEIQLGSNIDDWNWGKVHTIEHMHPIGRKKPFNKIFNVGPVGVKGGHHTINNIDFHLNRSGEYKATYGPAIRILLDFAEPDNSISVLPTGESGRFMSPHYDDQFEMYNKGEYRKQLMNKDEIIESSSLLKLTPSK